MAKAKVNIPYPGVESVAYKWPAGDDSYAGAFWERRRQYAIQQIGKARINYDENTAPLEQLGARMIALGQAERAKEISLLQHALPDFNFNMISDTELITKLNELIRGKEQFKYALDRIKNAIQLGSKKAKTTGSDFKGLGPSMASVFLSYLGTEMTNLFNGFVKQLDARRPVKEWGQYLEDNFDKAIDKAMTKMLEKSKIGKEVDKLYGDAEQWRSIGEAYRLLQPFQEQFRGMIRNKIGFEELKLAFANGNNANIIARAQQKYTKSGFRTMLDKNFKWKSRQASIGGSVAEYLEVLIANAMAKGGTITDRATKVMEGEKIRTDSVDVFQFDIEGEFSAQELVDELNRTMLDVTSLSNAAEKLDEFYQKNLQNLDDTFIIYTSTKNYSLGAGFSGFHNGTALPLNRLPDYIDAAGIDTDLGMDFVYTAYNTLPTAIYEDEREEIKESIENILISAAAKLMFDDWQTIGVPNSGAKSIHVFDLDGIIIPSSLLFIRLGTAMQAAAKEMRSWVSVRVKLPTTVLYHPGDWTSLGSTNEEIKQGIYHKWKEQFQAAEKESAFSVKFLYNFKTLMSQLIAGTL